MAKLTLGFKTGQRILRASYNFKFLMCISNIVKFVPILVILLCSDLVKGETSPELEEDDIVYSYTKQGVVKGVRVGGHYEFRKIPYAKPPVGELRYQDPQEPEPWSDELISDTFADSCIQYNIFWDKVEGVEDCLYLSVFTPTYPFEIGKMLKNEKDYLPVMVSIHAGGFMFGRGSSFRADYFMETGQVVVVTLQYRLGSFGFLDTEDGTISGNFGLKDQAFALKWVQENIHNFGGNKNAVTLFGTSAGGASVHYHQLSKASSGLFHRAISSSGCALTPWGFEPHPLKQARKLAQSLDCPSDNNTLMISCLRGKDATEIARNHKNFIEWYKDPMTAFAPTKSFLNSTPYDLLADSGGKINSVPWIIGFTRDEGLDHSLGILNDPSKTEELNQKWSKLAPIKLEFVNRPEDQKKEISRRISQFYFKGEPISLANLDNLTNAYSDSTYIMPVMKCAQMHSDISKSPVYFYLYDYDGEYSLINNQGHSTRGKNHMDDIQFLMKSHLYPKWTKGSRDWRFGLAYVKMMVEFAKTGVIPPFWADKPEDKWIHMKRKVDLKEQEIYRIDMNPQMIPIDPELLQRRSFWDSIDRMDRNIDHEEL